MFMLEGLDFSYDEDDLAEALMNASLTHPGISYRIDSLGGGGGGWPEISFFAADRATLRKWVHDVYSSGDFESDSLLADEAVEVS